MQTVEVSVEQSEGYARTAVERWFRVGPAGQQQRQGFVVCVLMAAGGVAAGFLGAGPGLCLAILGFAAFLAYGLTRQRSTIVKQIREDPAATGRRRLEIGGDGVTSHTEFIEGRVRWAYYRRADLFDDGLLLSPSSTLILWLPRDAFDDRDDYERVTELARSRVEAFTDRRRKLA